MSGPTATTKIEADPPKNRTLAYQGKLPKLPIPPLADTCRRYLKALEGLQDEEEHAATKIAVQRFLENEGPGLQEQLVEYAKDKSSYIEEFWYESYLSHTDPVVLALNPFFVLENDPTPSRGPQLPRAASLIVSSLGFIHDLRHGLLQPDTVRDTPLDMDQYTRLFGTSRIPTSRGCRMETHADSRHIVVLRRGQFYWFDVLDDEHRPLMIEREIHRTLQAILADADKTPISEVARNAVGVLSTENRKTWSNYRKVLHEDRNNRSCLDIVDNALFIVCLDDATPQNLSELTSNFLCGTYGLEGGVQVGTCTNRWYDKLQIIVCADGAAGINFEHTGVDGHTVLRFAADIFTEGLMLLARSINPSAPTLFHASLSPYAKSYRPPRGQSPPPRLASSSEYDSTPKKLEWNISPELRVGVRFAETRLSDLICQNDCQALEFKGYGKNFITSHGFSPDAFVQMAFQAAYFGLYGRVECVYEPAMTKAFLHGRTEAIRSVQPESVNFTKLFFSDAPSSEKVAALRKGCERHVKLTKECSQGLGQDRHLYALYCLKRRLNNNYNNTEVPTSPVGVDRPSNPHTESGNASPASSSSTSSNSNNNTKMPAIFEDAGWVLLNQAILSTSNCGNPALRLFGFGPTDRDGYGIGYIIKEDGLSFCASSKHLQTRRFLDTLQSYLFDIQQVLVQLHREANEKSAPFVDHSGVLRDSKTGRRINGQGTKAEEEEEEEGATGYYSFFDSSDVALLAGGRKRRKNEWANVGKVLQLSEY